MSYVDGFVAAVPNSKKQDFIDHALKADGFFIEKGALRVMECWGDDVPDGKLTDFGKAVQLKDDETVIFSWVEWPDKKTRDSVWNQMQDMSKVDDRISPEKNPMPFDGARLIYGGFSPVVSLPA